MCSSGDKKNNHFKHTLGELNQAIEEWDTITNKPEGEQDLSRQELKKKTKELLVKLEDQLKQFSNN